jgi:hypothetical protein
MDFFVYRMNLIRMIVLKHPREKECFSSPQGFRVSHSSRQGNENIARATLRTVPCAEYRSLLDGERCSVGLSMPHGMVDLTRSFDLFPVFCRNGFQPRQ